MTPLKATQLEKILGHVVAILGNGFVMHPPHSINGFDSIMLYSNGKGEQLRITLKDVQETLTATSTYSREISLVI